MNRTASTLMATFALALMPGFAFATEVASGNIETIAFIISIFNLILLITSLISIKQYFWPGVDNTPVFHTAHIVFVVAFYSISLPFLLSNRQYYVEYADLVPLSILGKFFFSADATSLMQLIIVSSVVFNFLFVRRSRKELERPYLPDGDGKYTGNTKPDATTESAGEESGEGTNS